MQAREGRAVLARQPQQVVLLLVVCDEGEHRPARPLVDAIDSILEATSLNTCCGRSLVNSS